MKKSELARRKIDELRNNKGLFVSVKYTSKWDKDGEKTTFTSIPTQEAIKSAALDIRHFIASRSPLIMGTLVRELRENPDVDIDKLNKFYDVWRQAVGDKKTKSAPHGVLLNMDGKDLSLREQMIYGLTASYSMLVTKKPTNSHRCTSTHFETCPG